MKRERKIKTEIYSRVSGYFRPVDQWNKAKREEFSQTQKADVKAIYELVSEDLPSETRELVFKRLVQRVQ